ncbi:MAG: growth inhibitor PemK [bacterium (Candidatus Ratteibacteria) CG_4_10_14_3_um_filter_41_18]|uniref:mRNA interferase n=4 Tax=Candidatus Ratteibacteria TaxID=2979319 RepID=A0A2M7YGW5_9BACT|nr:MAG: growth inhibitor PemK [Candidatus Omnitrophica bacterium CG1_02_41_171]PIV63489.1 MAG: growth inhibitor PemK [bacterium (Candidatus Ratteibacteria) CG01_land_8_20_14_3_00_40_19]PIW30960.1 MAG: growth inhibitor PemK [bacterium (Candidatus Ratteibacteria) CG15_BIG_FIL_POST_REV_8_21_14_020_41_12]PIW74433.1 MAG: growth inhibitor PemK [bacterium (Candidatus Ratteibacteria) CG_4_8_14_3_um_filter_41_36]PIX77162.1 MAG: growth inhibitor PemK [bacterium (Candidatus Ratteibacteria) CG_4_10_14_3_um
MNIPSRGEVWTVNLNPVRGHEQAGYRPGLVVSADTFNHGLAGLLVIIPITTKEKGIPFHVIINPPEGGVSKKSFIKCEDIRAVSTERLSKCLGMVSTETLKAVEDRLKILLNLS